MSELLHCSRQNKCMCICTHEHTHRQTYVSMGSLKSSLYWFEWTKELRHIRHFPTAQAYTRKVCHHKSANSGCEKFLLLAITIKFPFVILHYEVFFIQNEVSAPYSETCLLGLSCSHTKALLLAHLWETEEIQDVDFFFSWSICID